MDENLTSRPSYRNSGVSSPVCRFIAIRNRIRKFHTDSTQRAVETTHFTLPRPTSNRTNAYEIKEKCTLGGHSQPPDQNLIGSHRSCLPRQG
jgi:hypothetical protein